MNREPLAATKAGASAKPCLSERHNAMLAEMGVNLWWQAAPVDSPREPVPATVPARREASAPRAPNAPPAPASAPSPVRVPVVAAPVVVAAPAGPDSPTQVPADLATCDRDALEAMVRACQRCDLGQRRRVAVPGMGDPHPDWLIVGEAPGEEEDRQGLPFVGRAGHLLDKMLDAMELSREQRVYIANVIKCRPPHNRNPDPVEVAQCTPYLLRQVELLQPKIIVAMGRFAAHTVLAEGGRFSADTVRQMPLGKLRGQVHEVILAGRRLPVVVTYHPAYLLRSPAEKAKAWVDLCLAMDTFEGLHRA